MADLPEPITTLIKQLAKLPGVGQRSAQRLAFHVLKMSDADVLAFVNAIDSAKKNLKNCSVCGGITDIEPCAICNSEKRKNGILCIVANAKDVFVIEGMREFSGQCHVLGGTLSPMDGISPKDLNIDSLIKRVKAGGINEVILATNPDVAGEATASYLSDILKPLGVRVTRLAYGIPMGGSLEFIDPLTLSIAIEGRRDI
ncbi:MAG: recombination protein RecR [Clostridiales bacterium]|nr:recombination protein RecR [Clostridiales bacterium]